jgi:hypothetical protein
MSKKAFLASPHYLESIRGLHRLHELAVHQGEDSPEAAVVRDRLELPWRQLSDVERSRISGLSEDLYSLTEPHREALRRARKLKTSPAISRKPVVQGTGMKRSRFCASGDEVWTPRICPTFVA